ncbi:hypothetical protein ACFQX8_25925 [Klenkia terrae]|uniref:hypothetical protein n=1 Tax=Klenkia terrae TaxID=1052259 RepID=UPI00360D2268
MQPSKRSRKKPLLIGGAVLVVLLLVAGGLFFFLRGDDFSYAGRTVVEPQQVIDDAEAKLDSYAEGRGGVTSDDSGCWFRYLDADTSDVQDDLVCGPVLFVDGDPTATYLLFALTPSAGDGDVTFEVAAEPTDPQPQELTDRELLASPDGDTPPDGAGDLEVPQPPPAEAGYTAEGPFDDVELTAPEGPATLSGASARVTITGLAQADRVGTGDDARSPPTARCSGSSSTSWTAARGTPATPRPCPTSSTAARPSRSTPRWSPPGRRSRPWCPPPRTPTSSWWSWTVWTPRACRWSTAPPARTTCR